MKADPAKVALSLELENELYAFGILSECTHRHFFECDLHGNRANSERTRNKQGVLLAFLHIG